MTIRSDEITIEILILFIVLAIAFIRMLLLYWLIGKRILYNIPIGEKIFLFQNDYAYISLNQFEFIVSSTLTKITIYKSSNLKNYIYLSSYQNSSISIDILLWCVHQCTVYPMCKKVM